MFTYYTAGQSATFVLTNRSTVQVQAVGVVGNIAITPPTGKPQNISLRLSPLFTQFDDYDDGTVFTLTLVSGQGTCGLDVQTPDTPAFSQLNYTPFNKINRSTPPPVPFGKDGSYFIDQNGIFCMVNALGVITELGSIGGTTPPTGTTSTIWDAGASIWDAGATVWSSGVATVTGILWDGGASVWDSNATSWIN